MDTLSFSFGRRARLVEDLSLCIKTNSEDNRHGFYAGLPILRVK